MTGRELINQETRRRGWLFLSVPLAALMVMVAVYGLAKLIMSPTEQQMAGVWAMVSAIIVSTGMFTGTMLVCGRRWRCPACRLPVLRYFPPTSWRGSLFRMPRSFRYCPFCGYCFDDELPSQ